MLKEKNQIDVLIDKNKIIDDGEGTLTFRGGLTLTDESEQRNGTQYDIKEMDLSKFDGTVFADHDYSVTAIVGKAIGVAKRAKRVVADSVQFAIKESSLARFVYEMVKSGYINAVSIGTVGELDYETGIYHNAELLEFSFVGLGNNRNAKIQQLAKNTLEASEKDGIETNQLRSFLTKNNVLVEKTEEPEIKEKGITMNRLEELRAKKNDGTITEDETKELEVEEGEKPTGVEPAPQGDQNKSILDAINKIGESFATLKDEVAEIKQSAFDKGAKEPEFKLGGDKKVATSFDTQLSAMNWQDRAQMQVENFFKGTKQGNMEAMQKLAKINEFHKQRLIEEGRIAKNVMGMTEFGNFVTSPEMLTQIEGYRTDFSALLSLFPYTETNSLTMAWLSRSGEIDMQSVEMCDDDADGNLKPISEYEATQRTKTLEEMAAVTPVCTAATIFLAADLLQDAAAGYRNSYERNLARGIIAALELAAEDNDDASFAESGDLTNQAGALAWLGDVRKAIFAISQGDGLLVMNEATYGILWNALLLAGNGAVMSQEGLAGNMPTLWTKRVVVVPNELMPTIGDTGTYKTFVIDGANVVINHAIFYVNPTNFSGRQNGGLRYDLSTEAAYEINGETRSAFQRNEIVLRGSMFRGAVIRDNSRVGAVRAGAVIS